MKWQWKINIKDCLVDEKGEAYDLEDCDAIPIHVRKSVCNELKKVKLLDSFRERLENESDISTVDEFNNWLTELYDFCDENRIWLGVIAADFR